MSNFIGKYTKFICLQDCNDGQKNLSNNTIFEFKAGQFYGCIYTPWFPAQKNQIYSENEVYDWSTAGGLKGMVSAQFIEKYFMPYDEYVKNYKELNQLFNSFMEL